MYRALVIRAGWVSLCLLIFATVSFSQPAPNATPSLSPQQIVYTGSLFGYFRVPDLQSVTARGCPTPTPTPSTSPSPDCTSSKIDDKNRGSDSKAASAFLQRKKQCFENAILVGTGDNFAPRLEARTFTPAPAPDPKDPKPNNYHAANKELYNWYQKGNRWVPVDFLPDDLKELLARGVGTIPIDNVGCFLASARYAAIVPGKHDFYFGAERVRMLARFMAGLPKKEGQEPPQMLGANLVIKTVSLGDSPPQPERDKSKWPDDYSVLDLREGKPVYPWFSSRVHVKIAAPDGINIKQEFDRWSPGQQGTPRELLERFLDKKFESSTEPDREKWSKLRNEVKDLNAVYICPADDSNEIKIADCRKRNWLTKENGISVDKDAVTYSMFVPPDGLIQPGKNDYQPTFEPGKNYGFCLLNQTNANPKGDIENRCVLFPVYAPFFSFPRQVPSIGNDYTDPDPFVFLPRNGGSRQNDVAIFGVVDPKIGEQIGILNFSWLNQDHKLKSVVSAEAPAEALKEQLDYFQLWCQKKEACQKNGDGQFSGMKILLAQMSPPLARVLAARLPQFQVVVTEADQEQATSEAVLSTEWSPKGRAGAFIAVPSPYFDLDQAENLEGTLHVGLLEASTDGASWKLGLIKEKIVTPKPMPIGQPATEPSTPLSCDSSNTAQTFQGRVDSRLCSCLSSVSPASQKPDAPFDRVKWLTLCAMRERTGADVALIQKRDFYEEFRAIGQHDPDDPAQAQQILDRIIWKGDLLTLLYVSGSALKKTMDQSKKYDDDDKNILSLADEKFHGLEYLGIKKVSNEYLVNEVLVDDKKIYAVATTDYIAAGDTGYPDLAAALGPKTHSAQFPERLDTISGTVCRKLSLTQREADENCLPDLKRDSYLDASSAQPVPSYERPGFGSRLWKLFPFKIPSSPTKPTTTKPTTKDLLEQQAQHHPIWSLALRNFSLGFLSLSNNLTDAQLGAKFAAVSTSGVTAKKSHTITIGLNTRLSRSSHLNEFFVSMGIDYSEQSIGDVAPNISQLKNRLTGDAGLIRNIKGGRSKDRVGITFTLHAETPLQQPFTTFTLGTKDPLKITQNRSVLLLPRIGMRWQNGDNFFEVGGQAGREIQAFSGYRFNTQGSIVECLPSATKTFGACITEKSTPPMTVITKDSVATAILQNRPRAGLYWKYGLSIPFGSRVKYDINQEGNQEADFFFNFHQDNSADTRFLDRSKHSLKFTIWPSFSIGPSLQVLLYRNKVNHDFLFQKQFGFEANFSFNLFNRREKVVQLKSKP